jgi:hypothetical protein
MKSILPRVAGAVLGALVMLRAADLRAIETTYGEDPVPDTHRSLRPPYTSYGMDPIPVRSPLERWREFRYYRPARPRTPTSAAETDLHRWKWFRRDR